jgi:hypothetical protein
LVDRAAAKSDLCVCVARAVSLTTCSLDMGSFH